MNTGDLWINKRATFLLLSSSRFAGGSAAIFERGLTGIIWRCLTVDTNGIIDVRSFDQRCLCEDGDMRRVV